MKSARRALNGGASSQWTQPEAAGECDGAEAAGVAHRGGCQASHVGDAADDAVGEDDIGVFDLRRQLDRPS